MNEAYNGPELIRIARERVADDVAKLKEVARRMSPFREPKVPTDAQCRAAIAAGQPDRIQGFHYGAEFVIRDVWRPYDEQVIWRGPDTDAIGFEEQCKIERMRLILAAALNVENSR